MFEQPGQKRDEKCHKAKRTRNSQKLLRQTQRCLENMCTQDMYESMNWRSVQRQRTLKTIIDRDKADTLSDWKMANIMPNIDS